VEELAASIQIRPASSDEALTLYSIVVECGFDLRDRLGLTHWVPAFPRYLFEEQVARGDVYSVEVGKLGVVATFTASRDAPSYLDRTLWDATGAPALYIARLAVLPRFQRLGIGRACMTEIERLALEGGCRSVRLDAAEQFTALLGWYEKLGYRETCRYAVHGARMVGLEKLITA
jgi:GNAT superfamily N-acetyltransferase